MWRSSEHDGAGGRRGSVETCPVASCQTRTFIYDSLKRLTHVANPENGSTDYTYDENGNLLTRTDARFVMTSYTYDLLDRPLSKNYTGSTPAVVFEYQNTNVVNSVHRLTKVTATDTAITPARVYSTSYGPFDSMGRPSASTQSTPGYSAFVFGYAYNQAGAMDWEKYPSGREVTTCNDSAGRPLTVSGLMNGSTTAYVQETHYAPHGGVAQRKLGNNLVESFSYNNRLQLSSITAGSLLTLTNDYGTTNNNGNVRGQTIFNGTGTQSQSYDYDAVDRLTVGSEAGGWSQTYVYDRFGNRALLSTSSDPGVGLDTLLTPKTTDPNTVPYSVSTNQWQPLAGGHDAAGNLTDVQSNPNTFHADYDGENRLLATSATLASITTAAAYRYDGEGKRVVKETGGIATAYVYDAAGSLVAEYSSAASTPVGAQYLTADHLGSTRLVTNKVMVNGVATPGVVSRSDYLPFGQEVPAASDGGIKFTGQMRDGETGLDYFEARHYGGAMGRFTSPDPTFLNILKVINPQRWNLYAYGINNPMKYVDPDGEEAIAVFYPGYQVALHGNFSLPLGHAGVVIVAPNGSTQYFEYGRYASAGAGGDVAQGIVRNAGASDAPTPAVERDASGKITPDSMKALLTGLSNRSGKHGVVEAAVFDTNVDQDAAMLAYLEGRKYQNSNPARKHYSAWNGYNCGTLICESLDAAGRPSPAARTMQTPGNIFGNFIAWPGQFGVTQFFVYAPPTEEVTSKICFANEKGKMVCQ